MPSLAFPLAGPLGGDVSPSAQPSPPTAAIAQLYGEDLYFDVTAGSFPDYVVGASGDYQLATEEQALRQAVIRRIITAPEEWPTLNNFGVGARKYVKAKNTPAVRSEIATKTRAQLLLDPRVESVSQVVVQQLDGGGLNFNVAVIPVGRPQSDAPVVISFGITDAGEVTG